MLLGSLCTNDNNQMICAVGDDHFKIKDWIVIDLDEPKVSLKKAIEYFEDFPDLQAIGISSFGPLELRTYSPQYGYIQESSRKKWQNINLLGTFKHHFKIPIAFTTDVNSVAYGEYVQSILEKDPILSLAYITIGDGVGTGIVDHGEFIGYQGSPEIGHILPQRHPDDTGFVGTCPYQKDCLEGLVSTKAIATRMHRTPAEISMYKHIWDVVAFYVAQSVLQTTLFLRPQKVILGGSLINDIELAKIKTAFADLMQDYLDVGNLDDYIVLTSQPSEKLAILGNLALAKKQRYSQVIQ